MISKEKLEKLKLDSEENATLNGFIGKAVRNNYTFTIYTNKAGVAPSGGIQQVYNQAVDTLITYAGILDKNIRGHNTNFDPLADGETALMVGRVKATDLLSILQLIIREKTYNEEMRRKEMAIKELRARIDDLKTPAEKRADLEKDLILLEQA